MSPAERILVTGASGYLGGALLDHLGRTGRQVLGASRTRPAVDQWPWMRADITNSADVHRVFESYRPETVFHMAGTTNASRDPARVVPGFEANALGTVRMLDAAYRFGCDRFVHCASMEEPIEASTTAEPSSPYAASKAVGSLYAHMFHSMFGLPVVIARTHFVYGPGAEAPEKLVPSVIRSYLQGEAPVLYSPKRKMDWVFIDDAIDGFICASTARKAVGRFVDIGSGQLKSVLQFAEIVRSELGGPKPIEHRDPRRSHEVSVIADSQTTRSLLNWTSTTSFQSGVLETVKWYRERSSFA